MYLIIMYLIIKKPATYKICYIVKCKMFKGLVLILNPNPNI